MIKIATFVQSNTLEHIFNQTKKNTYKILIHLWKNKIQFIYHQKKRPELSSAVRNESSHIKKQISSQAGNGNLLFGNPHPTTKTTLPCCGLMKKQTERGAFPGDLPKVQGITFLFLFCLFLVGALSCSSNRNRLRDPLVELYYRGSATQHTHTGFISNDIVLCTTYLIFDYFESKNITFYSTQKLHNNLEKVKSNHCEPLWCVFQENAKGTSLETGSGV